MIETLTSNKEHFVRLLLLFIPLMVFNSCLNRPGNSSEPVLARVKDIYLYESEIRSIIPAGANPADSLTMVRNYVNNWVKDQLLVHKAEQNLTEEDMNFEQQLRNYYNSLVIFEYESKLIAQKLDTVVSETEIERYYDKNKNNFELKNTIVKSAYLKINKDSSQINSVRNLLRSGKINELDSLATYYSGMFEFAHLNTDTWILFDHLLKIIPIETYNTEAYLERNQFVEIQDQEYFYFVRFYDFKIRESISPLSLERENIRQIIINKRKTALLKEVRQELYETALENNEFEVFIPY